MTGLHSPFGIIGQIKEKTGQSHKEIMWGQPWIISILESADAPRYMKGKKPVPVVDNADDLKNLLGNRVKNQ